MFNPWRNKLLVVSFLVLVQFCYSSASVFSDESLEIDKPNVQEVRKTSNAGVSSDESLEIVDLKVKEVRTDQNIQNVKQPTKFFQRLSGKFQNIKSLHSDEDDTNDRPLPRNYGHYANTAQPVASGFRPTKTLSSDIVDKIKRLFETVKRLSKDPTVNFGAGFIAALLLLCTLYYVYKLVRCILCFAWRLFSKTLLPVLIDFCEVAGPPLFNFLRTLAYAIWAMSKGCWKLLKNRVGGVQTTGYRRTFNVDKTDFVSDMEKNEHSEHNQASVPNSNTVFVYDRNADEASIVQ